MALSAATLSTSLQSGIAGAFTIVDAAALKKVCDAIANAVVTHITSSAVVNPTALIAPPAGGPVTGTGTVL